MKKALLIVSLLGLLGLMAACQKDKLDDPTLQLASEPQLQLAYQATELAIGVETNQPEWLAVSNRDWLTAQPAGNDLLLTAKENPSLSPRRATVVVTAGGLTRTLQIEQAGQTTIALDLGNGTQDNPRVSLDKEGGEMRLVIKIPEETWSASTTDDWLEVFARPHVGELVLRATANETTRSRTGRIEITAGKAKATIEVRQKGLLHFLLPYNLWGQNYTDVEALELKRGSKPTGVPASNVSPTIPYYTFTSPSAAFGTIRYEFMDYGADFLYATTLISEDPTLVYSDDFLAFLLEEGYTRISPADKTTGLIEYRHTEQKVQLYIYTQTTSNVKRGIVYLYPIHEQAHAQETLADFSPGMVEFGKDKVEAINAWEAQHGGHHDEEFSSPGLRFYFVPDPYYARGYFVDAKTGVYEESIHFYSDYTRGAYLFGKISYPTREWNALMERKGYSYVLFNPASRGYLYRNATEGINVMMRAATLGPRMLLRLNIWPVNAPAAVSAKQADLSSLMSERVHQSPL